MSSFMSTSSSKDDLSTLPTSNRNSANSSSGAPGGVSRSGSSNNLQTNGISSSGTDVVKRGILLKRGRGKVYHPWQLRTVIIRSDYKLYYFEQEILKGTITLEGTKVCAIDTETAGNRPYGFEISNIPHTVTCKVNSLILVAGSEVERDDWIHAIELAARFAAKSVDTSYTSFGVSDSLPSFSLMGRNDSPRYQSFKLKIV